MDNIENLIIGRLGEHQRKVDFIRRNMKTGGESKFSFRRISITVVSVAACVAVILGISPMLFQSSGFSEISVGKPSFSEFRGSGFDRIEALIENEQYEEAFSIVGQELIQFESELEAVSSTDMAEEEKTYLTVLYNGEKDELMWSQIYLTVKMSKIENLKEVCQNYLSHNVFGEHEEDVRKIMEKIK